MKFLPVCFGTMASFFSLISCAQKPKAALDHLDMKKAGSYSVATFAAGCFWHEEALFESIKGVKEAVSGYAGGSTKNPSYEAIENGNTGHAETVNVYYDSSVVSYATLLRVYFAGQNPVQSNGQGNDLGTQYRSIIFYRNASEKSMAESFAKGMQKDYKEPIAAQIVPFTKFWEAEGYHQNYIELNPGSGYVRAVSIPEIKHVQKLYPQLIKPEHVF
ncbi:MAG: peptide-methionine (S)-S-oxide reductase MsrA [Ferruginibacter sp.]